MAVAVNDESKAEYTKKVHHSKELLVLNDKRPDLFKVLGSKKKEILINDGPPKIFRVEASSVLSRVRCFLPDMARADQELKRLLLDDQSKQRLVMESTEEGEPCIEIDVAVIPVDEDYASDIDKTTSSSSSSSGSEEEESESDEHHAENLFLPLRVSSKHKKRVNIEEVT